MAKRERLKASPSPSAGTVGAGNPRNMGKASSKLEAILSALLKQQPTAGVGQGKDAAVRYLTFLARKHPKLFGELMLQCLPRGPRPPKPPSPKARPAP